MGGGSYYTDVSSARSNVSSRRAVENAFDYSAAASAGKVKGAHADVLLKTVRECCDFDEHPQTTPIVLASDVTDSRGDDAKVIFAKLPAFMAALKLSEVVPDPSIMWAAFGDANYDKAPVQICQFEADRRLDEWLSKLWLEGGGGGNGEESSELVAWFLAHRTKLDAAKRGVKGFAFFTTDEAPYPTVNPKHVKELFGIDIKKEIPTEKVFRDLSKLYDPFVIFPRTSMTQRKKSIDREVQARLERLGGRFKDVDLRATLVWNTRDDLDLHVKTPDGDHIYFAQRQSRCGGELDVDRNVRGDDPKPVENIRWASGQAPTGQYEVWVHLYRYWESRGPVEFTLHIDNGGELSEFTGTVSGTSSSSKPQKIVFRGKKAFSEKEDPYANYDEQVILEKWGRYVPSSQILRIKDPESIVEVMLGTMALKRQKMDLAAFIHNMEERRVAKAIRTDVAEALEEFSKTGVFHQVNAALFTCPPFGAAQRNGSAVRRAAPIQATKGLIMPRSWIVIGLAYGDESKGGWVDHLVRQHTVKRVVRFNGGAQAGHQVVTSDGREHIFAQFGAGMFVPGVETMLSRFMLVEPEALLKEANILECKQVPNALDRMIVSEDAPVISPMNRLLNRMLECSRGNARHGSCGFGIGLTQADVETLKGDALYVRDLRRDGGREKMENLFRLKLDLARSINTAACPELLQAFEEIDIEKYAEIFLSFYHRVRVMSDEEFIGEIARNDTVFEGAQGVLLDQRYGFFPHCTRSTCTYENAQRLLREAHASGEVTRIGLLRGYGTRHGAGPFVTEDSQLTLPHCHNHTNDWQGNFRIGWFDAISARYAIEAAGGVDLLAITNLDRMNGLKRVKLATAYESDQELEYVQRCRITAIEPGYDLSAKRTAELLTVTPRYQELRGWNNTEDIALREYLDTLAGALETPVGAYSVSQHHQKIYR